VTKQDAIKEAQNRANKSGKSKVVIYIRLMDSYYVREFNGSGFMNVIHVAEPVK